MGALKLELNPLHLSHSDLDFRQISGGPIMQTTRRAFLGAVGAAAALGVVGEAGIPEVRGSVPPASRVPPTTTEKQLFWVAASTPCDKSLNFDPELYKDVLAYLKEKGADGVVVLGTTGEFPSFSWRSGKKSPKIAFKNRNGLEHHRLARYGEFSRDARTIPKRASQRRERLADRSALLLQASATGRIDEIFFADF